MEENNNKLDLNEINEQLSINEKKAEKILQDKTKAMTVLEKVKAKTLKYQKALSSIWTNLKLMMSITKDWVTGKYRAVPFKSIIVIMSGLLYLISPVDLIPDILPGGLLDDIFILKLVMDSVGSELEKYRIWKEMNSAKPVEEV